MGSKRNSFKGTKIVGGFVAFPFTVIKSPSFTSLTPHATKLLLDIASQYVGSNNGDLSIAWKILRERGWASQTTLHKAKNELTRKGFLFETRKGQRPNKCSLYALTWFSLDPCPKHDPGVQYGFIKNAFAIRDSMPLMNPAKNASLTPPAGVMTS